MITNLHTHTVRCRHARDPEEAYVIAAMENGIRTLGFSDHTPQWFGCDYYSRFRMYPQQLPEYMDTVLSLKQQYAGEIDIRLGLEAEYYPAFFPELMTRLKDTPVEYLLLGQHYVGNEIGDHYSGWETADEEILRRYCHQVADAMYTGLFTYLAHPELIHFVGDDLTYRHHMRTLCRAARDCDLPLEINFLGMREGRHYPNEMFWEVAGEEGCKAVLGCDAHSADSLHSEKEEAIAREIAARYDLEVVEQPLIRRI